MQFAPYFAGLFDGEGSVYLVKGNGKYQTHYVRLTISNTDPRPLIKAKELYGGSIQSRPAKGNARLAHDWVIACSKAVSFLKEIRPYLMIKSEQVDLVLEFAGSIGKEFEVVDRKILERREQIMMELRKLKRMTHNLDLQKAVSAMDTVALADGVDDSPLTGDASNSVASVLS